MSNQTARVQRDEDVLRETLRARVEDDDLKLPLLPEVAQRVLLMADDPSTGIGELARLINRDPSLCAHVLRAANSPWYCRGATIISVRQALAQLGADNLSQIAWTIAIGSSVLRGKAFARELDTWWTGALAAAFVAKDVARTLRVNVETAFLCGLMNRIGRPMVYEAITMVVDELDLEPDVAKNEARALVSEFERPAGLLLAAKWKLPDAVTHALTGLERLDDPTARQDAALAAVSQHIADCMLGSDEVDIESIAKQPACAVLNLYSDAVADIVGRRDQLLTSIEAMK